MYSTKIEMLEQNNSKKIIDKIKRIFNKRKINSLSNKNERLKNDIDEHQKVINDDLGGVRFHKVFKLLISHGICCAPYLLCKTSQLFR